MRRGEIYRVHKGAAKDPRKFRFFVVVSRQALLDSKFSSVICAPIYSKFDGLTTQIRVGADQGLKKDSAVHCDELISLPKNKLTQFVSKLPEKKLVELNDALLSALDLAA